ncbi:hypothetical protein BC940DRAFT_313183 [Gongronella butleri]|nr:hypothetical protein BC940DRAFT_313183 [Gongronella butleri]
MQLTKTNLRSFFFLALLLTMTLTVVLTSAAPVGDDKAVGQATTGGNTSNLGADVNIDSQSEDDAGQVFDDDLDDDLGDIDNKDYGSDDGQSAEDPNKGASDPAARCRPQCKRCPDPETPWVCTCVC